MERVLRGAAPAEQHAPLALLVQPVQGGEGDTAVLLARRGGLLCALRPVTLVEHSEREGSMPQDWQDFSLQEAQQAQAALDAAATVCGAGGGDQIVR